MGKAYTLVTVGAANVIVFTTSITFTYGTPALINGEAPDSGMDYILAYKVPGLWNSCLSKLLENTYLLCIPQTIHTRDTCRSLRMGSHGITFSGVLFTIQIFTPFDRSGSSLVITKQLSFSDHSVTI